MLMMKGSTKMLNQPEKNVILLFEPRDFLSSIAGALAGDDFHILHAHDEAAFDAIIE